MAPNSSLANSIARSIFSSASKRVSSITCSASFVDVASGSDRGAGLGAAWSAQGWYRIRRRRGDQRADLLTFDGSDDRVVTLRGEDQHRQSILLAQAERGGVDHLEPAPQCLVEGYRVELAGGGIGPRVGRVDAVHPVLAHQHDVRVD